METIWSETSHFVVCLDVVHWGPRSHIQYQADSFQLAVALAASPAIHHWPGYNYRRIQERQKEEARKKSGPLTPCVVFSGYTCTLCMAVHHTCDRDQAGTKQEQRSLVVLWAALLKDSLLQPLSLFPFLSISLIAFPYFSHVSFPIYSSSLSLCNCSCTCAQSKLTSQGSLWFFSLIKKINKKIKNLTKNPLSETK